MTADPEELFTELAKRLLCPRWHQNQASYISKDWLDEVDKLREEEMTRRMTAAFLRAMTTMAQQQNSPPRSANRPRPATRSLPSSERQSPRRRAERESAASDDEEPAPAHPSPASDDDTSSGEDSSDEETISVADSTTSIESDLSPSAEPEAECSICFETLDPETSTMSCRTQCQHKFHTECMTTWFENSDSLHRTRSCPYW